MATPKANIKVIPIELYGDVTNDDKKKGEYITVSAVCVVDLFNND